RRSAVPAKGGRRDAEYSVVRTKEGPVCSDLWTTVKTCAGRAEGRRHASADRARRVPESGRTTDPGGRNHDRRDGVQRSAVGSRRGNRAGRDRRDFEVNPAIDFGLLRVLAV